MTRRLQFLTAAAAIALAIGIVLVQRQVAWVPVPARAFLPIQEVSKQNPPLESDLETRKREQFKATSPFFDGPELPETSGSFSR